jgi:CHAT domain-containing protein
MSDSWWLLGAPVDERGADLLPGARDELTSLAQRRPGSRLVTDAAFSRTLLAEALRSGRPLHLATHLTHHAGGALVTSDGTFGERDVRAARPQAPLAVLSTCWSGGGQFVDAEGLFGLARAFLGSGTRNLVVTLWPVEDQAAKQFGILFHQALSAGMPPSRAASRARDVLREEGRPSADWGAFRLIGRD